MKTLSPWLWPFTVLSLFFIICLGYTVQQQEFGQLLTWYILLFGLYVWSLFKSWNEAEVKFLFGVGMLMRLSLMGAMPGLSDDLYRFVWDGRLWVNGYNPFDHLPAYYMEQDFAIPGIDAELYHQLNSPQYYTIYPPIAQLTFALSVWLFPNSIWGSAIIMRSFLLLCEAGSLMLIWRILRCFQLPVQRGLIYVLNPLIILEITGNLHYEGAMIFFLLWALWWWVNRQTLASAVAISLSVASKLLPLMFLPLLVRRLGLQRSYWYFPLTGLLLLILFSPLFSVLFLENFSTSLDLYFRKFEFNGSIYYLLRWIGYQYVGYNLIAKNGPALAMVTLAGILWLAYKERHPDWHHLPTAMLLVISLYLLCTTTVHPWYTSLPIVLCVFTRFRYPVLWSGLIMLTYINYSYPEYHENLWIVALEYAAVGVWGLWEVKGLTTKA